MCTFPFFFGKYTLHACYVFNAIWRFFWCQTVSIPFWSNGRAAPTVTNPNNLELSSPQSVTDTRLDQLVYSPNCYIQIFTQLLYAVGIEPATVRSKVQRATDCTIGSGWDSDLQHTRVGSPNRYGYILKEVCQFLTSRKQHIFGARK